MLKGSDIIIFGGIDWDMQWQWQQEIAERLSKDNRVVFVENTGVRTIRIGDANRVFNRIKNFFTNLLGFRTINKNLVVFSPIFFPFPYNNFFIKINSIFISSLLKSWTENINFNPKYIFSFISTPLTIKIINKIQHDNKIFLYTDKMSKSSLGANRLSKYTEQFAKSSNLCFYSANDLKNELKKYNKNLFHFPGGVDFSKFNKKIKTKKNKKKIIGYIGQVKNIIDFNLILKISKKFTNAEIQLVGPIATPLKEINFEKNIKFIGQVSHEKIPDYVKNFDVGIIPYIKNDYTDNISPAKLTEYLSLGLPCISTNLKEIINFNKLNNKVVDVSKNDNEFIKNINKHLNMSISKKKKLQKKRIKISKKYDWNNLFNRFKFICENNVVEKNFVNQKSWSRGIDLAKRQLKNFIYKASAYLLLIYGVIFYTPMFSYLGSKLTYYDKLEKSDAILVVSGSGSINYLNTDFQSRYSESLIIYKNGLANKIVIMRREHNAIEEGDLIKKLLIFQKVPEKNIFIVDREFKNTFTNFQYINKYYLKNYDKIILSTSPYHSLRSKLFFENISNKKILIAKAADNSKYNKFRINLTFGEIKLIVREYLAIVYAYFRGWI